jgi:Beta-ketoacyl synthase, N-terminal domain
MSLLDAVYIEAIGVAAPGLPNWRDSGATLRGSHAYAATSLSSHAPSLLPANEQRRATATVRLAFKVAEEAIHSSEYAANSIATVFASSDADMLVSHRICTALAQTPRFISPTDFHNSVHNAPSGYWHIGAVSRQPSSAIAAHDYSFTAGLLEAMTQVTAEQQTTLLVCYDVPAPEPLLARRPLANSFAVAIVLASQRSTKTLAKLALNTMSTADSETVATSTELETLRLSNPAARALPLLQQLAERRNGELVLRRSAERCCGMQVTVT